MTPNPTPLLDRVTGFFARLADRIAGFGDPAGRDRAGCEQVGGEPVGRDQAGRDQPGLEPAQAGVLLARLRHLLARFRAVAATPVPPPKPEPKPTEPRFVPTHRFRDLSADPLLDPTPEPIRLPRARCWLSRLVPQAEAERAQLEELLRDPATRERLAADPRLGRLLRPLGWMLGVERALLPPSRWRPRQMVVVPGGHTERAAALEEYAAARAKGATAAEVLARCCVWIPNKWDCGWDRGRDRAPDTRPGRRRDSWLVWRGCVGPVLPGLAQFSA